MCWLPREVNPRNELPRSTVTPLLSVRLLRIVALLPVPNARLLPIVTPSSVPLLGPLLVLASGAWAPSARARMAGHTSWSAVAGPCVEQNTRSAVGRGHAQVGPLFTRPNWSSERTSKRRCLLAAAQLQR